MNVRDELRDKDPDLWRALDDSWKSGQTSWLAVIQNKGGTHHAAHHCENMERRLNELASKFGRDDARAAFRLSPVEKYLLLAAILFHDIGKAYPEYPDDHAYGSYRRLITPEASYHIPPETPALAHIIAKLALHHAPPGPRSPREHYDARAKNRLSERTVDPYGRVREADLSALLILLDHLDTSYTRTLPPGLASDGVKTYRGLVQGVELDPEARAIRSVLGGLEREDVASPLTLDKRKLEYYALGKSYEDCYPRRYKRKRCRIREVAKGTGRFDDEAHLADHEKLAVLQANLRDNVGMLDRVRDKLHAIGIPLDGWLIELDEHLFNHNGCEVWEPIFDAPYLKRVATAMWDLSARVFGRAVFTYETLAAAVRDPEEARLRRAVRRLKILSDRELLEDCEQRPTVEQGAVEAYDTTWRWRVAAPPDGAPPDVVCSCVNIRRAHTLLDTLEAQR